MKITDVKSELSSTTYPGRGIIIGKSADGKKAVSAYWTMGRSAGSRNRVCVEDGDGIRTQAFDPSLIAGDPSLIIYAAVRVLGKQTIVTNGDQTDTIYDGLKSGLTFEQSLRSRKYEHDAPNYTPRISGVVRLEKGDMNFAMSIIKSAEGDADSCQRYTFAYSNPKAGKAKFIHTYKCDGNPLPSFEGEPKLVKIEGTIDSFAENIWKALNAENKVSLFVRFIDIESGKYTTKIFNKNV